MEHTRHIKNGTKKIELSIIMLKYSGNADDMTAITAISIAPIAKPCLKLLLNAFQKSCHKNVGLSQDTFLAIFVNPQVAGPNTAPKSMNAT